MSGHINLCLVLQVDQFCQILHYSIFDCRFHLVTAFEVAHSGNILNVDIAILLLIKVKTGYSLEDVRRFYDATICLLMAFSHELDIFLLLATWRTKEPKMTME